MTGTDGCVKVVCLLFICCVLVVFLITLIIRFLPFLIFCGAVIIVIAVGITFFAKLMND